MKIKHLAIIITSILLSACSSSIDEPITSSGDPISQFMTLVGEKKYNDLTQTFSPDLKEYWNKSSISEEIINIRESLGETWKPEETNSMNWQTPQGLVVQKSYRLQESFRSKYSISFTSKLIDKNAKIVNFNATTPYEKGLPKEAESICAKYIELIQKENYSGAREMVLPTFREQITDEHYKLIRGLLVTENGEKVELITEGHKTLINGVWYETAVVSPRNGFMQHLTVYLSLVNGNYSVVTVEFKNPQKIN